LLKSDNGFLQKSCLHQSNRHRTCNKGSRSKQ